MKSFLLILASAVISTSSHGADTLPTDTSQAVDSIIALPTDSLVGDSLPTETTITVDTILFEPGQSLTGYHAITDSIDREQNLDQRPMVAMFKSLVLPGWGQLGNRRHIKALVYFGLEVWMVGATLHYDKQVSEFRQLFDSTPLDNTALRNDYYTLFLDRKDERSKYTWLAVIVAFVSMFDAYVDAHLSGFPRQDGDNLIISITPTVDRGVKATMSIGF